MELSKCVNTEGSYSCECFPGYERKRLANGSVVCEGKI